MAQASSLAVSSLITRWSPLETDDKYVSLPFLPSVYLLAQVFLALSVLRDGLGNLVPGVLYCSVVKEGDSGDPLVTSGDLWSSLLSWGFSGRLQKGKAWGLK